MYSLNLDADNRILSACVCFDGFEYTNMVDTLPEGDITEYKYISNEYVYEPSPKPEPVEPEPTAESDIQEMIVDHEYRLTLLELGI